jgi:hypothetical protein
MGKAKQAVTSGDVYDLKMREGNAFLHAIGVHGDHGWAVRVLVPSALPSNDVEYDVSHAKELFVVLVGDLAFAERKGWLKPVGRAELPPRYRGGEMLFRSSVSFLPNGQHKPDSWWLDDGDRCWRVKELTAAEQRYPLKSFTPVTAIESLIEREWDPDYDFKGPGAKQFSKPASDLNNVPKTRASTFVLMFDTVSSALAAKEQIEQDNVAESVTQFEDDDEDVTCVTLSASICLRADDLDEIEKLDTYFEGIALKFKGDYDGNEIAL